MIRLAAASRPPGRGLRLAALAAILAHALLLLGLIANPLLQHAPVVAEVPDEVARIELVMGDGAQQTGTPPAASPAPAPLRPEAQAPPPAFPVASPLPDDAGVPIPPTPAPPVEVPPPPSPPAEAAQAPPPTPDVAPPMRSAPASIRLGDGIAAPHVDNPLDFVTADPDVRNVAPEYPLEAARRRERGLVRLALHVDATGKVTAVAIVQSSGSPRLDEAARKTLSTWHFRPAFKDGHAVETVFEQPIEFTF